MRQKRFFAWTSGAPLLAVLWLAVAAQAEEPAELKAAQIRGSGPHWRDLTGDDFVNVNCADDTWTFKGNTVHCTGQPVGVIRSKEPITNFELVAEWRHNKPAGNSGIFVWGSKSSLDALKPGGLPHGIEVQILDPGYETRWEEQKGSKSDWFTSHGDVFPTGPAKMKPFPPLSANGTRSFPSKRLVKKSGEWNHYYVRAINGEVRLWVNGEEVSGGTDCQPATGYLCLESEGSPIDFRNLRIRVLP